MPIRWSALKVSAAMDMAEEFVNQAAEPLEQARLVLREARKIDNLPGYVDDRLTRILGEIERAIGGSRDASVRIFTDYLVAVREQEYQGYWLYLLDFRNGLWEHPIDNYRSHYACLTITKFKD